MPQYAARGAQLEPPVRTLNIVYVKTLYRIVGRDYCLHHVIRAAVAAGITAVVRPGAVPAAPLPRKQPQHRRRAQWRRTGPTGSRRTRLATRPHVNHADGDATPLCLGQPFFRRRVQQWWGA